ncbi:hypothetical protein ACVWWP_000857 [Bradyrhizobium sp. LM3.6]
MSDVVASRRAALVLAAAGFFLLAPSHAQAQWWKRAPVDFEACADAAEKAATKTEKTSALADCNAKFAGRRKAGGGYSYYDFLQDRSFDIAGPNPTPEEQKKIDESYTAYLAVQRRSNEAAQAVARQQREQQEQQAATAPAGRAANRGRARACAGRAAESAAGRHRRRTAAAEGRALHQGLVLLRMAAAVGWIE